MNITRIMYALQHSYDTTETLRDEVIDIITEKLQDNGGLIDIKNMPVKQFLLGQPREVVGIALSPTVLVDEVGDETPALLLAISKEDRPNVMPLGEASTPVLLAILDKLYFGD